jgi:indolepyruvate ferredoxin oxidoreductase beta subunit
MKTYNLVFAGVGGQGVITAAGLLARAALLAGLDVRMYGSYGMAQRGGSVSAHLRLGTKVLNARIEPGQADILVGLELMETVRLSPLLRKGAAVFSHDAVIQPAGKMLRGIDLKLKDFLGANFPGNMIFDAASAAGPAGIRGINAVLLGAASGASGFPVGEKHIEACIREDFGDKAGPVIAAFTRGRELSKR